MIFFNINNLYSIIVTSVILVNNYFNFKIKFTILFLKISLNTVNKLPFTGKQRVDP